MSVGMLSPALAHVGKHCRIRNDWIGFGITNVFSVRAENYIGGYVIHRAAGSTTTRVRVASMSDPCGYIPKWLVNLFTVNKFSQWLDMLVTACAQVQATASLDRALRTRISACVSEQLHQGRHSFER